MEPSLATGDRIVDLAGLLTSAAAVAGNRLRDCLMDY